LEAVRRIRTMRGMNQVDLANASGVAQNTISEIELGKRKARPATLKKLADALEVEISDLVGEAARPKASRLLDALTVGGQPVPTFKLEDLPEQARTQLAERGYSDPYFVPLEEGEEEEMVKLEFRYVRLLEGDEPIIRAMWKASPDEEAKILKQLEKSGRTRE
jgi:transcriptional regulator with XRE-family HTH domain